MIPRIFCDTKELIIIDKVARDTQTRRGVQGQMLHALNASVERIYEAHEIWFYDEKYKLFTAYKNKHIHDKNTLLGVFMEEHGIDVGFTTETGVVCFTTKKDEFLFKLKFL